MTKRRKKHMARVRDWKDMARGIISTVFLILVSKCVVLESYYLTEKAIVAAFMPCGNMTRRVHRNMNTRARESLVGGV